VNLTVLLADAAQIDASNKISALGMGWTHTTAPSPPMAVVGFVELEQADLPFTLAIRMELRDADDTLVTMETAEGPRPVVIEVQAQGNPLEESRAGEPVLVPVAAQLGPGMFSKPGLYAIHVTATREKDGESVHAVRDFLVLPPAIEPQGDVEADASAGA
jgi:hypothetical protein